MATLFRRIKGITGGPRLSRKGQGSTPQDLDANLSKEMLVVAEATAPPELFHMVLNLLPNQQTENKFRLVWALQDYHQETDTGVKRAKARKLQGAFLQLGSKYECDCVPAHILRMDLKDACPLVYFLLLSALAQVPEMKAALDAHAVVKHGEHHGSNLSVWTCIPDWQEVHGDLVLMAKIEALIHRSESRQQLVGALIKCSGTQAVQVRFVNAVNQYMACEGEKEKDKLGKSIRIIFKEDGIFHISYVSPTLKTARLEDAQLLVLKELSVDEEMTAVLSRALI
jgi:hypothetical protein